MRACPPPFTSGTRALVESVLAAPQRSAGGQLVYPTLLDQAAVLFYEACKMHAFVDGNKRMAVLLLLAFLGENDRRMNASNQEMAMKARDVAASRPEDRAVCISELANWIGRHNQWLGNR